MAGALPQRPTSRSDFEIAIVCALPLEADAVRGLFDHGDPNEYSAGVIGCHNVLLGHMPGMGTANAAAFAAHFVSSFPNVKLCHVVGICGAVPFDRDGKNIFLGDVAISEGVVQYDLGWQEPNGFVPNKTPLAALPRPNARMRSLLSRLKVHDHHEKLRNQVARYLEVLGDKPHLAAMYPGTARDTLFEATHRHGKSCEEATGCTGPVARQRPQKDDSAPAVHFGLIASGNWVMMDAEKRDTIAKRDNIIAFEMEGAGTWDSFPHVAVIKGASDYADSHKSDGWKRYAAAAAAACMKAFLEQWRSLRTEQHAITRQPAGPRCPLPKSNKIFLQETILIRKDVLSFLNRAFGDGVSKTTMARYFAYQEQAIRAVLWIPSGSESEIRTAFLEYSKILTIQDREPSNFVSVVGERLTDLFANNWIIIFDGLDDHSAISLESYNFPDLPSGKVLVTTQNASISDRIDANYVMQVPPLDEKDAEELLLMTATRGADVSRAKNLESAAEVHARKRVVRELGYPPVAISIVGGILRGSLGSSPTSCEGYIRRCDESRDEDLDERPILTNYHSVWRAFEICFATFLSDQTANSRRAAQLAFFVASFQDSSSLKDCVQLYRPAAHRGEQVSFNRESTGSIVMGELRFLDHGFFRRSFDKLTSTNFITGNWTISGDDHVPYIEMHSLLKKWLRRRRPGQISSFVFQKLWLLGFGMCWQLEQFGVETHRYKPLKSELRANIAEHRRNWSENTVPCHDVVMPFVLGAMSRLTRSIKHLPVDTRQRPDLEMYSDTLKNAIEGVYEIHLNFVNWTAVFDGFINEMDDQVEDAVGFDSERSPNYRLPDFFLQTLDSSGCLPIAFQSVAPDELQIGGQIEPIEELKEEIVRNFWSLLSTCFSSEAIEEVADMCRAPHHEHQSRARNWAERWADDMSAIIKRAFDEAFSSVRRHGIVAGAPTPVVEMAATGLATLFAGFSPSHPRNTFFATLRQVITAVTGDFLQTSGAADALHMKCEEIRDKCERSIRRALGERAEGVFFSEPFSSEAHDHTAFSMLWELAWAGRFAGGLADWVGSVVMDSISQDLKDVVIKELENFLRPHCSTLAPILAGNIKDDSGVGNIFLNWISSGWVDLPDDDTDGSERLQDNDIHEAFDNVRARAIDAIQSVYAGGQHASSREAVFRALEAMLGCRRALHHDIMGRLARPGLNDRAGIGPFFAKVALEECDKELVTAYSMLTDEIHAAHREELSALQQVEKNWRMETGN